MSNPTNAAGYEGAPLALTESHLLHEALSPTPLLLNASTTLESTHSDTAPSSSETLHEATLNDGKGEVLSEKRSQDLEHGVVGEDPPLAKPHPKAQDGTDVIVVDWEGDLDPTCPKNWTYLRRMGATLM